MLSAILQMALNVFQQSSTTLKFLITLFTFCRLIIIIIIVIFRETQVKHLRRHVGLFYSIFARYLAHIRSEIILKMQFILLISIKSINFYGVAIIIIPRASADDASKPNRIRARPVRKDQSEQRRSNLRRINQVKQVGFKTGSES